MKKQYFLLLLFFSLSSCFVNNEAKLLINTIKQVEKGLTHSVEIFSEHRTEELVSPRSIEGSDIIMVKHKDWTSGFFPGSLWLMYELKGDNFWKEQATQFTLPLEPEKWNGKTHDMGFKMYLSFGKAYEITKEPKYREILIQSAKTLATRFKPNIGCIRSWDHNADKWDYPVIIDNMMNLELLFWAARETGNEMFKDIAVMHAETTMKNHFRSDNSSYHVIDYNPQTGEVQDKNTHQGFSAESSWSRGQAWGLYGYTMVYRETKDVAFLEQAEKIADFILNHPNLPTNYIPYWDFDAPEIPNEPYDASAAAIMASALYELSGYSEKGDVYINAADKMLISLSSPEFLAEPTDNFGFLLKHSTGSKPHNSEVDVPLIYADYYFIEALVRKQKISTKKVQ